MASSSQLFGAFLGMAIYIAVFATGFSPEIFNTAAWREDQRFWFQVATSVFKALPIFALSQQVAAAADAYPTQSAYLRLVRWGLLLCSVGDISLDLEDRFPILFLVGLGSFLVGHLLYVGAFVSGPSKHSLAVSLLCIAPVAGLASYLLPFVAAVKGGGDGTPEGGPAGPTGAELLPAVVVYMTAITAMLVTASARRPVLTALGGAASKPEAKGTPAPTPTPATANYALTFAGAATFCLSDAILAVDKFAFRLPFGKVWVMVTYYGAQALIALAARRIGTGATATGASKEAAGPKAEAKKTK